MELAEFSRRFKQLGTPDFIGGVTRELRAKVTTGAAATAPMASAFGTMESPMGLFGQIAQPAPQVARPTLRAVDIDNAMKRALTKALGPED